MGKEASNVDEVIAGFAAQWKLCNQEIDELEGRIDEATKRAEEDSVILGYKIRERIKLETLAKSLNGSGAIVHEAPGIPETTLGAGPESWQVIKGIARRARVWGGHRYLSCCRCMKWHKVDAYYRRSSSPHGRQPWCKACVDSWGKQRTVRSRELS